MKNLFWYAERTYYTAIRSGTRKIPESMRLGIINILEKQS
jgi:hypothetical protein